MEKILDRCKSEKRSRCGEPSYVGERRNKIKVKQQKEKGKGTGNRCHKAEGEMTREQYEVEIKNMFNVLRVYKKLGKNTAEK